MSVSLELNKSGSVRGHRYSFHKDGLRHRSPGAFNQGCVCKKGDSPKQQRQCPAYKTALEAQTAEEKRLERVHGGLEAPRPKESPFIYDFAMDEFRDHKLRVDKVDEFGSVFNDLKMALRFFGRRPIEDVGPNRFDQRGFADPRPYWDLRLDDLTKDPSWVAKFEKHLAERGISGGSRNKQRNIMSQLYDLAKSYKFAHITGINKNPFDGVDRDETHSHRQAFSSAANLVAVRNEAPEHLKIAIDIALFAIKFRRGTILSLEWSRGPQSVAWLNEDMTEMMTIQHKNYWRDHKPQVVYVVPELRQRLLAVRARQKAANKRLSRRYDRTYSVCNHVIQWAGRPVKDPKKAFRSACERAGVQYGRESGVTFHSLRHEQGTEATFVPEVNEQMQQALLGHRTNTASQHYRHTSVERERQPLMAMQNATLRKLSEGQKALEDRQRERNRPSSTAGSKTGLPPRQKQAKTGHLRAV